MPSIGNYLYGRHISVFTVAPVTVNANTGEYTVGTPESILGVIDPFEEETTVEHEEISPLGEFLRNPVAVTTGTRMVVREILANLTGSGNTNSRLRELFFSSLYLQFSYKYGAETMTTILLVQSGRFESSKGRHVYTITGETVALSGGANPIMTIPA